MKFGFDKANDIENLIVEELKNEIINLKQKNDMNDKAILNLTHDLKNYLSIIIFSMQALDKNLSFGKYEKSYIEGSKKNSYKMLKIINNFTDSNRLENEFYKLNKKNIEVISLLEGTVNSVIKYALKKNINIIFDTNKEECILHLDPEAIDRVLMNLLSNAIKFSKKNSTIYVTLNIEKENLSISVKDEGKGISYDEQKNIFNRFYQISMNNKEESAGCGIGLDLSNSLVKAHGGVIQLFSEVDKGTEFKVVIPKGILDEKEELSEGLSCSSKVEKLEVEFSDICLL